MSVVRKPDSEPLVSAIILSLNKQDYLRSQLAYYSKQPIHLVLADGSDSDWGMASQGRLGSMTWDYFRMSGPNTYIDRLIEACRRISTDLVFLIDDEDCTLWTGVVEAVEFLYLNPDFSVAGGDVATVVSMGKRLALVTNPRFGPAEITQASPLSRARAVIELRKAPQLYYQVHRIEHLRNFAEVLKGLPMETVATCGTKILSIVATAGGKCSINIRPFSIRRHLSGVINTPEAARHSASSFTDIGELANRVVAVLAHAVEGWGLSRSSLVSTEISDLLTRSGEVMLLHQEKSRSSLRRWFAEEILQDIFDLSPLAYRLLRRGGMQTIEDYVKLAANLDRTTKHHVLLQDLTYLEKLWTNYPRGLSLKQFESYRCWSPDD